MEKRTLEILIEMGMKPEAVNKTIADFKKISAQIEVLNQDMKNISEARDIAFAHGEDTKKFDAQLKLLGESADKLKKKLSGAGDAAKDAFNLRDIGEKLNQVGMGMQNAGRSMLAPLQGAMAAYMEQQTAIKEAGGQMSESAKAYLDAQKQMQQAYVRIGAIAMDKLLPAVEIAADLLNKFASFIEQNPTLITAIAGLGVGLSVVGTVVSAVGQMAMIAGALQGLGIVGGGATAGGGLLAGGGTLVGGTAAATAGSAAVLIAAPLLAGMLTKEIGNAIQNALGQEESSWSDIVTTAKQLALIASPLHLLSAGAENLGIISTETEAKIFKFQKNILGLGDAAEKAAPPTQKTAEEIRAEAAAAQQAAAANKQFTDSLVNFQLQSQRAEEDYYRAREDIQQQGQAAELDLQRSHAQAIASAYSEYNKQVEQINTEASKAAAQAAAQYAEQSAQATQQAQEAESQAKADHLDKIKQIEEEHSDNVWKITQDRDALALVEENNRFGKAVGDENESYTKESAQRKQELQSKLAELAAAYQQEKAQAAQQAVEQLAQAKAQYEEKVIAENEQYQTEQARQNEQQAEKLRALDEQYQLERQRKQEDFALQISDLDASLLTERNRKLWWYQQQLADLDAIMKQAQASAFGTPSTTSAPGATGGGLASGGYANDGIYRMGELGREFVANADTTRQLEKVAGGSLTQDRLMALAARGKSSAAPQINLQQEIAFNGDLSASNKASFRSFMRGVALETFQQVMAT